MHYQEVDIGTRIGFVCGLIALLMILVGGGCNNDDKIVTQSDLKNRVPNMQSYADRAQAAADRAEAAQKKIDATVDKLNGRDANGNLKLGRAEQTRVGTVTEFGNAYFIFVESSGFTKKFSPLCDNQTFPAGHQMILNYHWASSSNMSGCYQIDSTIAQ